MRAQIAFAVIALAATSAALGADLIMRPGRWEVRVQMDFAGKDVPPGMPFAEPFTSIDCLTAEEATAGLHKEMLQQVPENCTVSDFTPSGKELTYSARCKEEDVGDVTMKFRMTVHSPDSYSATSTSYTNDPSKPMTMEVTGKRTGDACSAKELAEDAEDDEMEDTGA